MIRTCAYCQNPLSEKLRCDARYCNAVHRALAHRERTPHKEPQPRATPLQDAILAALGCHPKGLTVWDLAQLLEPDKCDQDGKPTLTRVESIRRAVYVLRGRGVIELASEGEGYVSPCKYVPVGNWRWAPHPYVLAHT